MKYFTIENETNNITIHAKAKDAEAVPNSECFSNEAALAKLAAGWPAARLVEIWNSLPGETPVKKFKDRTAAVSRIWKALQNLAETIPAETAKPGPVPVVETPFDAETVQEAAEIIPPQLDVTPVETEEDFSETREAGVRPPVAPQSLDTATAEAPAMNKATRVKKSQATATAKVTRQGSKTEAILALIKQPGGAMLKVIMEATQWQAHSVRGFVSGTLNKKMGLTVISVRSESGERTYLIKA
jgi:hypothetical protein